jgi:hypothetical protein
MVLAFLLGTAAFVVFWVTLRIEAFALLLPAGGLVAWLVPDRRRGLGGLLAGVALTIGAAGADSYMSRLNYCAHENCSGLSSPGLTAWFAIAFLVVGIGIAAAGYGIGRVARRWTARRRRTALTGDQDVEAPLSPTP